MITPMEMALESSKRDDKEFNNIFVFSLSANNYEPSVRPADDVINEILGLKSLHGSYVISKSASDTAKEYLYILIMTALMIKSNMIMIRILLFMIIQLVNHLLN